MRDDPLYRAGAWLYRQAERILGGGPPAEPEVVDAPGPSDVLGTPEVRAALAGRYGARTRASPGGRRSMTLFSALPVWDGGRVVGAVEVSQSTNRLFRALDQTRLSVFKVFLTSVAVAAVLSLLVVDHVRPAPPAAPGRIARRSSTGAAGCAATSGAPGAGTRSASWRGPWRS